MDLESSPYENIATHMGLGTAPALESIELQDDIPVAINPDEINREATRYLFFPGDVLPPSQKRERPDLRTGGEYYGQQFKTLIRSKGLIRRCQITPLEIGFDFMSDEMIGDDANLHVVTTVEHNVPGRGVMQAAPAGKLNGIKIYPGDEIKGILQGERNNTSKGIVELTQLAGVEFSEFRASGLQEQIFPDWQKITAGVANIPTKISELQLHFEGRKAQFQDKSIRDLIDGMLASCDQYRTWGLNYLKFSSQLVRLPANHGFVHTYSELAEMLFEQLEVRREDMMSTDRDLAEIMAKANAGNNISSAETQALLAKMTELLTHVVGQAPAKNVGVETVPVEAVPVDVRVCGKPKANGEPCTRTLEAGEMACFQHKDV